jgi:hypothetical protein
MECSGSRPDNLLPGQNPGTHWTRGCWSLDYLKKIISCRCRDSNTRPSSPYFVAIPTTLFRPYLCHGRKRRYASACTVTLYALAGAKNASVKAEYCVTDCITSVRICANFIFNLNIAYLILICVIPCILSYDCNHSTNKCTIILYYIYIYIYIYMLPTCFDPNGSSSGH